jgi:hypothetical protein
VHRSCLSLLILRENVKISQFPSPAYRTRYFGGRSTRRAVRVSGRIIVPPTLHHIFVLLDITEVSPEVFNDLCIFREAVSLFHRQ